MSLTLPIWLFAKTANRFPFSQAYWSIPGRAALGAGIGGYLGEATGGDDPEESLKNMLLGAGAGAGVGAAHGALRKMFHRGGLRGRVRAGTVWGAEGRPLGISNYSPNDAIPQSSVDDIDRLITSPMYQGAKSMLFGGPIGAVAAAGTQGVSRVAYARSLADAAARGDEQAIRYIDSLKRRPVMDVNVMQKASSAPPEFDIFWDAFEDELPKLANKGLALAALGGGAIAAGALNKGVGKLIDSTTKSTSEAKSKIEKQMAQAE